MVSACENLGQPVSIVYCLLFAAVNLQMMYAGENKLKRSGEVVDQAAYLVSGGLKMGALVLVVTAAPGEVPTTGTYPEVVLTACEAK